MKVDLVATQPHYREHLLPIWNALPDDLLGTVHPTCSEDQLMALDIRPDRVVLVASGIDTSIVRGKCKAIYVEHGAGQTYAGDPDDLAAAQNPSYSNVDSRRWPHVIGFIAPSQRVADRWTTAPSMAVGCPKMDRYINEPWLAMPSVCFTFHWDAIVCNESRWTFDFWGPRMREIGDSFRRQGYRTFAHQHPKWKGGLTARLERSGWTVLNSDEDVFIEAAILFADNTSLIPEFASLGKPVCWLNGPNYRRDIHHGMRFWEWTELAPTFDRPNDVIALELDSLEPPKGDHPLALDAYKYIDGMASQRAAMFVAELVRAL